ncbi:hypothetical protein GCM10011529_18420 [Polymorphobacter glacialis]|uniref:Uncharacterized protein n=1 Tax=Sandarakinorhabdus glacialis TaxID=1614636 RepID=A0A916ZTG8_9SPHN|nr:hypothetical protein [Polymorphobacter glacialis]GGE12382.1 hypothetical protein GCM10011529_18420 [Polymorphobacter glacialis]
MTFVVRQIFGLAACGVLAIAGALPLAAAAAAQPGEPRSPAGERAAGDKQASERAASESLGGAWGRMTVLPGGPVDMRPVPPRKGRDRCIAMNGIAGAQMFGDRAMELTMRNGGRFRLFFSSECPALSFYQGFYYRRSKAGQLCAGRDAIGARSGGECAIASIIAMPKTRR